MAVRPLRFEGDQVLREVASPVTHFGDEFQTLIADLFDTMYDAQGRGLAAPQVGVSTRAFVIDTRWKEGEREPIAFVNPEILDQAPFLQQGPEACLSIPERTFNVQRPVWVDLAWTSPSGIRQNARFHGVQAVCVCHELDHLNGVLITDHGTEV
ncbi:peptide deformylase [Yoonia sp. 2307UL14-13]|uniref:peptide deformylase n=1 Tax=Yoonia sp. 2307UL14-13 TaxID=3126506 RepID=UPI00309C128E